jgi:SAM-dependent methyltransferase
VYIENNGIYLSDSLALLERIGPELVTLAYVDPPTFPSTSQVSTHNLSNRSDDKRQKIVDSEMADKLLEEHLSLVTKVLQQLHRVLNHEGNLFFQSEHHLAGDYRKILDQVFGRDNYRSEIIWPNHRRNITRPEVLIADHHTIFHYSKTSTPVYNQPYSQGDSASYTQHDEYGYYRLESLFTSHTTRPHLQFEWKSVIPPVGQSWHYTKEQLNNLDKEGKIDQQSYGQLPRLKVYLTETKIEVGTLWNDIPPVDNLSEENLNFQSQRPLALLDRIINIGSNQGDLILDPFCGAGTTLVSAQLNGRKWLGCDISEEAYYIAIQRIENECKLQMGTSFLAGDQSSLEQSFPVIYETYIPLLKNVDRRAQPVKFVLDEPLAIDETRHMECKEIKGDKPLDRIKDQADKYAIAFLNSEGGQIFWGVRDTDKAVTGVKLSSIQRDDIRLDVTQKLHTIQPPVAPTEFRIELYQVYQDDKPISDLYVVHLTIPATHNKGLYYTSSGKTYVRVDGLNTELKGPQLEAEILKRFAKG